MAASLRPSEHQGRAPRHRRGPPRCRLVAQPGRGVAAGGGNRCEARCGSRTVRCPLQHKRVHLLTMSVTEYIDAGSPFPTRRQLLTQAGLGFGAWALLDLMERKG